MSEKRQIDPARALDQLLQVIRQEAPKSPEFGRRLLEAVGYEVVYRGEEAVAALDPVLLALKGYQEF